MTPPAVRIGTRGSQLALWQARAVATRLEAAGSRVELVIIRTAGDRLQQAPLSEIGGKRLFVKELEDALLRHEIDIAVHSAKDMSAVLPDGLTVAATLAREDPRDVLVLPVGALEETSPVEAADVLALLTRPGRSPRVGTGSVRRQAQLAPLAPGAHFTPIRGNVDTRLGKLDRGDVDLLVLAAAGLRRLGFAARISAALPPDVCVPAPGQGIIAIELRCEDGLTSRAVQVVHDERAAIELEAERTVVAALGGGCQLPLGALAVMRGTDLDLHAVVCSDDGMQVARVRQTGRAAAAADLGRRVAEQLAKAGALEILNQVRSAELD